MNDLIEQLADAEHASWARWMDYLFDICDTMPDGSVVISPFQAARWKRQAKTKYADLSEREKESDRDEVRRILPVLEAWVKKSAP